MARRKNLTLADLPLFASDEELGEAVLGFERRREFDGLATLYERLGMPKIDMVWGGRYVPAVKAFLDVQYGLAQQIPFAPHGKEGAWVSSRNAKRPLK